GIRFIVALLVRLIVGRGAGDLEHVLDDVRQRLRCKLRAECFWMRTRYETVQESFAPVGEPVRALCCPTIILRQDGYEFRLPLREAAARYVEQGLQRLRAFPTHRLVLPSTCQQLFEPRGQCRGPANGNAAAQEAVRL